MFRRITLKLLSQMILFFGVSSALVFGQGASAQCDTEIDQGESALTGGERLGGYTVPSGRTGNFSFIGTTTACSNTQLEPFIITKEILINFVLFPGTLESATIFAQTTPDGIHVWVTFNGVTEFVSVDANGNCTGACESSGYSEGSWFASMVSDLQGAVNDRGRDPYEVDGW